MNPQEMNEIVTTYNDYLERLNSAIRHFCEDLEANNYQEVSEVLPAIVEGLDWLNDSINQFVALQKISEESCQSFRNTIGTMNEALENKDYMLLHDALEYDLLPLLSELKVVLN